MIAFIFPVLLAHALPSSPGAHPSQRSSQTPTARRLRKSTFLLRPRPTAVYLCLPRRMTASVPKLRTPRMVRPPLSLPSPPTRIEYASPPSSCSFKATTKALRLLTCRFFVQVVRILSPFTEKILSLQFHLTRHLFAMRLLFAYLAASHIRVFNFPTRQHVTTISLRCTSDKMFRLLDLAR